MTQVLTPAWNLRVIDGITLNVGRIIKYGAWVLIARYGYYSVVALAGKQTIADLVFKIIANFTVSRSLCWVAAGGGVGYGAVQRKLRKRMIKSKAKRIKQLEEQLDPSRTSSALMSDGSTRPEDEES
jgi:hypothetical protein